MAGSDAERDRLPWKHLAEMRSFETFVDIIRGSSPGRTHPDDTLLFINLGLQGVQFAAVAGRLYELASERRTGSVMDRSAFLQHVRD